VHFLPLPRRLSFILAIVYLVCLLATSHKNYLLDLHENFTRDVSLDKKNWLNFESHLNLDMELATFLSNVFGGTLNLALSMNLNKILKHCEVGIFPQFGSYLWKNSSDPVSLSSGFWLQIRTGFPLAQVCTLQCSFCTVPMLTWLSLLRSLDATRCSAIAERPRCRVHYSFCQE